MFVDDFHLKLLFPKKRITLGMWVYEDKAEKKNMKRKTKEKRFQANVFQNRS